MTPGLGPRNAGHLLERFRSPREIFRAGRSALQAAGVAGAIAQSIASGCAFDDAVLQQEKALSVGASVIPLADPRYPERLREIFDPPILLFARGDLNLLSTLMVGIVGTRRPTPYGFAVAERLASDLASAGLTVVSGMARGIDTAAHRGALAVQGPTIAVFGCGVDVVYPSENRKLAVDIASRGLLLSESPMGTPAYPQNFPTRNRIVSGLSEGIIVVEGAEYSGSSITARLALDQGREVFAVPGNVTSKMSWGPNLLIKQGGAQLIQNAQDVLEGLPLPARQRLAARFRNLSSGPDHPNVEGSHPAAQPSLPFGPGSEIARNVLNNLPVDAPMHLDELLAKLDNYSSSELIATLFELELAGLLRQLPGKNFVKVWLE